MTDIESRMEANGLPTKFESAADAPTQDHSDANLSATIANAEVDPIPDLKMQGPSNTLETSMLIQPVEVAKDVQPAKQEDSLEPSIIPDSQPHISDTAPYTNGDNHKDSITVVNGHKDSPVAQIPQSSPMPAESSIESNTNKSVIPSSIPNEDLDPNQIPAPTQYALAPPSDTPAVLEAPISNLRTSPHTETLAPESSAVEAGNSEILSSNNMVDDPAELIAKPDPIAVTGSEATPSLDTINAILAVTSDPSPPPPPEPAHAELPPQIPAAELVPAPVPAEKPTEPAPTPMITESKAPIVSGGDVEMEDAPITKVAREREDDDRDVDEPLAKRARTDENTPSSESEFKVPEIPTQNASEAPDASKTTVGGNSSVTIPRLNHMKKVISNLKKSNASSAFRLPVDPVALNIPTYTQIVKHPMDLGTIDQRLKNNEYTSISTFVEDFETIVNNCILFNGREHGITQQAIKMQSSFNNQMANLPPAAVQEPSKAEKKAMKLKTEPMRQAPPRRPSVTTPGSARSPKSAAPVSTPSFAPGPDGVPLIRRDSSLQSDRPKRAIIPPKRNSDFAGVRPKKKKYELQLRFCQEVLKEIASPKYWQINQYFTHPVDPVALNIPTYFQVIKKPMDLGTVQTKLETNQYEKAKDFEEDVRMIFKNCYKFNPEGDFVNQKGHELEELFDQKWAGKDDWIAAREPHSEPSEPEEVEEEEEASEEEENDSEDDRNDKIKALQAQIEAMSKQMGELTQVKKKKKTPPMAAGKKSAKPKAKKDKASATFPGLTKAKEKKKPASKAKADRDRYVTFAEKQYISNGIAMLPERQMQEALKIIQSSVPSLANSDQNEIELDIEEVPNHALLKLLNFVKKYAGPPPDEPDARGSETYAPPAVERGKKSKPMSKTEQEAQIAELKGKLGAYGGPVSPDALQSVETGGDSSDESADSEESEEE